MPLFTVTIFVEGFLAEAANAADPRWLGRTLTVALTEAPARNFTDDEKARLAKLLCPWRWEGIEWRVPGTAHVLGGQVPAGELEAYLAQLFEERLAIIEAGGKDPLNFRWNAVPGEDEVDDAEETLPIWPGLLAQLSRCGPQLAHPLKLAHAARVAGAGPHDLAIDAIRIDGTRYPADGSGATFALRCEPDVQRSLASAGRTGLVDHSTRLVVHGPPDEQATAAWLAELPARLGRAIDPLARLADLVEAHGVEPATFGSPLEVVPRLLLNLFGGPAGYDPSRLQPIFLAIADLAAAPALADKAAFAAAWSGAFGTVRTALVETLAKLILAEGERLDANALREVYADGGLVGPVQQKLAETVPAAPPECRDAALRWLAIDDNIAAFLWTILPQLLARSRFLPELTARTGQESGDWQPLYEEFDQAFADEMEKLGLISHPKVLAEAKEAVFHLERDSVDAAARDGLPFRADTLFHDSSDGAAGKPDIHAMMDGYLVAISASAADGSGWSPYTMVSRGAADIVHRGDGQTAPALPPVPGVHTPLPVVFEVGEDSGGASTLESRIAAASYHGQPMIPWSARELPASLAEHGAERAEPAPVEILYAPDGGAIPPLAYGQDYRIACGYQAPGGLLPAHFAADDAPLVFSAAALEACPPRFLLELPLRRTLLPGAPRLLRDGGIAQRASFAGPRDSEVRPLWREHVALWPSSMAAERRSLAEVATLYLDDGYAGTLANRRFEFTVRPPSLALGEADDKATTALVWRYWRERDRQWAGPGAGAPLAPPTATEADDPAVVGKVKGGEAGRGGVYFQLHGIGETGLQRDLKPPQRAPLAEGQRVDVIVVATLDSLEMSYAPPDAQGVARLEIRVPRDVRCLLEASTICDGRFLAKREDGSAGRGEDERFAKSVERSGIPVGDDLLFGTARVVIEALPGEDHLPPPEALWRLIDVGEQAETGRVSAAFALPAPAHSALRRQSDFVGTLCPVWQTWRWDGGPVYSYRDLEGGSLSADRLEPAGARRDPGYLKFEAVMFEDRREAGASAEVARSAGAVARLFELESLPNRGADYLRVRLEARSRYAALRPGSKGNARPAAVASAPGEASSPWRGYTIGARRRDPMPTPRLALAAPLFGRVFQSDATAGGLGLYLDHAMFDPRFGGGLDERLEVAVTVEHVDRGFDDAGLAVETAALTVGADPILAGGDGDPFEVAGGPERLWSRLEDGSWTPGEPARKLLKPGTILGQTLEPQSPAPSFPFAIAFVEPALDQAVLRPDTMAKIEVRSAVGEHRSKWSAPLWVHFPADMGEWVERGGRRVPAFVARADSRGVLLSANAAAGAAGRARIERLVAASGDSPGAEPGPYVVAGVLAVLVRTIEDAAGKRRPRVAAIVPGRREGAALRFDVPEDLRLSHLRILEVQRVTAPAQARDRGSKADATGRWFGADAPRHIDGGPHGSLDIGERVVGVGPLVAIAPEER